MKNSFLFIGFFLLLVPLVTAQLQIGFYNSTCPRAELIVRKVIQQRFKTDHSITAAFLRMHFHDCFVRGCDASVLIDPTKTTPSEKDAVPNQTVRGFNIIDQIKKKLEAACPGIVSCADIITLATRESVALAGGPNYTVPTGRRDGLISDPNLVNVPGPTFSVSEALQSFTAKGLTLNDMVTLLGAHTVGVAHCDFFLDRLSDFQGTGKPDPTMDPALVSKLFNLCGTQSRPFKKDPTAFLDQSTPFVVDNQYYNDILSRRGIMQIDQELALDNSSASIVSGFANDAVGFQRSFADALVKMGSIEVLVGNTGQIRKNCRVFN
ncbi:peroxidase 44-like [Rhododendron vialii]|uniref:peroxidase 44-like n=1 Tax=Rhododendron vialii TaxID=182163 RepID=UPI00265F192C|nr:peroxidase 44-like [Rhododendron vialii]